MTTEERLDQLTERHEALAQTVELILRMQLDLERKLLESEEKHHHRFERVLDIIEKIAEATKNNQRRLDNTGQ